MALGDGHEPIFRFHPNEGYHPLAVESAEEVGEGIAMPDGSRTKGISLDSLPDDGLRMVLPTKKLPAEEARLQKGELARVGYRQTVKGGGLEWVQYWLWYLYNPKRFFVAGEHEGDWEFVQIGYGGGVPVCDLLSAQVRRLALVVGDRARGQSPGYLRRAWLPRELLRTQKGADRARRRG